MSSVFETYDVAFRDGIKIRDTHSTWDERRGFTSVINGMIQVALEIKIFDEKIDPKIKVLLNYSHQHYIRYDKDSNRNQIVGDMPVRAGDRITITGANFVIWEGRISLTPFDPIFDAKDKNDISDVEYKGSIVKINKPGYYKISTKNGQFTVEPTDE